MDDIVIFEVKKTSLSVFFMKHFFEFSLAMFLDVIQLDQLESAIITYGKSA
ncbi:MULTISPECIES: hypothetical protein [Acinetobacter]|uniref:hypothetical protein n=1 Tax=Acinetobacter TaxID=469 RepID=UPI001903D276|nr:MULTISPECIES: hypothetical protein [Acinetobacter]MBJ9372269.1 hypothetical protein [Acinetobacter sp. TGL-Y2]MDM1784717.1 hypothetical protein [Acinetobacter bereziniae]